MTRLQPARPSRSRRVGHPDEHWQVFIAFWLLAGLTLLTVAISTFADVAHAHRLAALLMLSGILSLAIGFVVRRAGRAGD